jgi:hypothetical protein
MDLGTYQNYNQNLPNLQLYRYENIFKTYQTQDANKDFFYNIIKNIFVPGDISNDAFFTTTYQANIPLTTLSYQIYGTTYLWWLICIVNGIQNPLILDSPNASVIKNGKINLHIYPFVYLIIFALFLLVM